MPSHPGKLLAVENLSLRAVAAAWAEETMVANPCSKFLVSLKPGARAVHRERTKLSGPEGKLVRGEVHEKRIVHKLVKVEKNRAVSVECIQYPDQGRP